MIMNKFIEPSVGFIRGISTSGEIFRQLISEVLDKEKLIVLVDELDRCVSVQTTGVF